MSELLAGYTALPNLHPALVHFPIALLPLAVLSDLLALVWRGQPFWDRLATLLYGLGACGALAAVRAGVQAADSLTLVPPAAQPAIAEHSDAGHRLLYLFAALAAVRLFLWWRDRRAGRSRWRAVRGVVWVAGLLGLGMLFSTADQGGALVYRHGLGVQWPVAGVDLRPAAGTPSTQEEARGPIRDAAGVLRWRPGPADADALGTVLRPAAGFTLDAVRVTAAGERGLGLAVDGRTLLVLEGLLGDVQVDAELDLSGYRGLAGVAHHVQDAGTRAHFAVTTEGAAELVDLRDGARRLLDESRRALAEGALTLSVAATGRHLKGMVDGATVAHGHFAPGPPGQVGLLLDGRGTLRLRSLTVTPLAAG